MTNSKGQLSTTLEKSTLERVDNFIYLGYAEIYKRIKLDCVAFGKLPYIF